MSFSAPPEDGPQPPPTPRLRHAVLFTIPNKKIKKFKINQFTMDSDDDEIYGSHPGGEGKAEAKMEDVEDGQEEGEELESSDDDVNFITDAKEEPKPKKEDAAQTRRPDSVARKLSESRARSSTPLSSSTKNRKRSSTKEEVDSQDDKPGSEYPPVHVSKIDPNGNPIHPATGKPILSTDFDADFPTESSKPWRKPGADQTDYFNYGFDEFSFAAFTLRQQQMPQTVTGIRKENEEMQQFVQQLGNNGMPVPTGPSGGANAGGMPDMTPEQMQQMMMMMSGAGANMMPGDTSMMGQNQPPTGPQGGFHGGNDHGGYGGGGGFGGRGRGRRGRGNW